MLPDGRQRHPVDPPGARGEVRAQERLGRLPLVAGTTPRDGDEAGTRALVYADEPVTIPEYGTARQITWFENGTVAMQVLTSDLTACPVALLRTLKSRWRIESAFKYAGEFFGIDALADYLADIQTNTRPVPNPARKKATTALATAENEVVDAERALARLLSDPTLSVTVKNEAIPTLERPHSPRLARALGLLLEEINAIPPRIPGGPRPITYTLAAD